MTNAPRYVDFHCHLDLYPDLAEAIAMCEASRTATLAVTTTPKAFRQNVKLARGSEFVRVGLGLHPQVVAERWSEMPLFEAMLSETRYVGEIGLDAGPGFYKSFDRQVEVFRRILTMCAEQGGKILSIHSVRSGSKVLDHLEELLPPERGRVVLHWFSGTAAEARRAANFGCYFSVNQAMFRSDRGRALVAALPADRLLTETDGPFVEIEPGQPVEPGDVAAAVRGLATAHSTDAERMRKLIVANLTALVS